VPDKVRPLTDAKTSPQGKRQKKMNKTDLYEVVTQKIIDLLDSGVVPWQIPWRSQNGMPRNMISNRPYIGINFWMLSA